MKRHHTLDTVITLGTIIILLIAVTILVNQHHSQAARMENAGLGIRENAAPVATSGDNIYIAWWTNKTGNNEVLFRASTDSGTSFGDQINLSNTTDADSTRVEIDSEADSVVVTWWETNQTDDTPVMRVSNDNGATFGPLLRLATNGTIGGAG